MLGVVRLVLHAWYRAHLVLGTPGCTSFRCAVPECADHRGWSDLGWLEENGRKRGKKRKKEKREREEDGEERRGKRGKRFGEGVRVFRVLIPEYIVFSIFRKSFVFGSF